MAGGGRPRADPAAAGGAGGVGFTRPLAAAGRVSSTEGPPAGHKSRQETRQAGAVYRSGEEVIV